SSSERSIEYLDAVVRTVGFCRINVCSRRRPYFRGRPDVPALVLSVTGCCCRRESVPPQTTRPLHWAKDQASARYQLNSFYACPSLAFLRLAERPHGRPTRHTDSLASHQGSECFGNGNRDPVAVHVCLPTCRS